MQKIQSFVFSVVVSLMMTTLLALPGKSAPPPRMGNRKSPDVVPIRKPSVAKTSIPVTRADAALQEVDYLLFCNQPERLTRAGAYADAKLIGGKTYRIFFHYRNTSGKSAPLTLAFHGTTGKPLPVLIRKGIADAQNDPPNAGRQAMMRYLVAQPTTITGAGGAIAFPMTLHPYDTASGIVTVRPAQDCRFRIFFAGGRQSVQGAKIAAIPTPRRQVLVTLSDKSPTQYFRIGQPDDLPNSQPEKIGSLGGRNPMDGSYGMVYSFSVKAPAGRKVRVTFSPRGGQAGMVALINGVLHTSDIIGAASLAVFAETRTREADFELTTMPFGGVFYPVEIAFHLL